MLNRKCPKCKKQVSIDMLADIWIDNIGIWYTCIRPDARGALCNSTMLYPSKDWEEFVDNMKFDSEED